MARVNMTGHVRTGEGGEERGEPGAEAKRSKRTGVAKNGWVIHRRAAGGRVVKLRLERLRVGGGVC